MAFAVTSIDRLIVRSEPPLREMYKLSPFVWRERNEYHVLIRAVPHVDNPAEKVARIYHGRSTDGIAFEMDAQPAISPGRSNDDNGGCEDPSVAIVDGTYYVYYTGWNEAEKCGQLMLATGSTPSQFEKHGVALPSTPEQQNPKEATIVQAADGSWRLFYEFATDGASRIGVATGTSVAGPWRVLDLPFKARTADWDSWHLSTGPFCNPHSGESVMFYNGSGRDADWRIGWIAFDDNFSHVIRRCTDPIIAPPANREPGSTDIAFAASAVEEEGSIALYYSVADKDMHRATIRRL